jgi:ribosomal protein S18 acetylase RimI-like enzyme
LLTRLEQAAAEGGADSVRLDTHDSLTEAMGLYRSTGYQEIGRYNDNPHAQHWFSKPLCTS